MIQRSSPTPPDALKPTAHHPSSSAGALTGLALTMLLSSLGTSIANVGLPTLAQAFAASFQQVQWVILAYLLTITASIVTVGRIADIVGRRRLLLAGISVFTAASFTCGIASSLTVLIAARAAQGLGAAVMMALSVAIVGELVPREKTGSALGLLGSMSAVGTALGPALGGLLIAGLGWRAMFLIKVPLGITAVAMILRYLPMDQRSARRGRVHFDHLGTVLLAVTLAAYALAMTLGRGAFGVRNVALLVVAGVGCGLFVVAEQRAKSPLVQLAMFRDRHLAGSLLMSALVATVLIATLVVGPFYLSRTLGLEAIAVGLVLSVGPIAAALTGVPAGRAVDRFGSDRMTLIGLIGIVVGLVGVAIIPVAFGIIGYITPMIVVTGSYALFQTANNTSVMADISPNQRGVVSGLLNLSRNLGLITGAAVMGAVFAHASSANDISTATADGTRGGMRVTFIAAAAMIGVALVITTKWRARAARPAILAVAR